MCTREAQWSWLGNEIICGQFCKETMKLLLSECNGEPWMRSTTFDLSCFWGLKGILLSFNNATDTIMRQARESHFRLLHVYNIHTITFLYLQSYVCNLHNQDLVSKGEEWGPKSIPWKHLLQLAQELWGASNSLTWGTNWNQLALLFSRKQKTRNCFYDQEFYLL